MPINALPSIPINRKKRTVRSRLARGAQELEQALMPENEIATERIKKVWKEYEARGYSQTEFGELAGADKSTVSQWLKGSIKKIAATYAFRLERKTGYRAEWLMLGTGPERIDEKTAQVIDLMCRMSDDDRQKLVAAARSWLPAEEDIPAAAIKPRPERRIKAKKSG